MEKNTQIKHLNMKEEIAKIIDFKSIEYLTSDSILYVISVISNPIRFARRLQLFEEFCERMKIEKQVKLITVELQYGNRPFTTDATIKLRSTSIIWHKENMINIAVKHLPVDWKYMAWIDADIEFINKDWVSETIELLQIYKIIQLFSHAIDLGPKNETMHVHLGFFYQYINGELTSGCKYENFHPGYGFAMTRTCYNDMGGLMDFPILGSADRHMAASLIGSVKHTINKKLHKNYILLCEIFQDRCEKNIKRNVGFLPGTILHYNHGQKFARKYNERWFILVDNQFDPLIDIYKDHNDLWQLGDEKIKLRNQIRRYFEQRNEDDKSITKDCKYIKSHWF